MIFAIVVASLSFATAQTSESRDVTIDQGPVRGYKAPGSNVFDFYGIPYATAPTGTNKFKVRIFFILLIKPFRLIYYIRATKEQRTCIY